MPLIKSASDLAVKRNISELSRSGRPQRQAVAIALDLARRMRRRRMGGVPR